MGCKKRKGFESLLAMSIAFHIATFSGPSLKGKVQGM